MPEREAVRLGQHLSHAQAMADAGIGLEAQQAARDGAGQPGRLFERHPGLESRQARLHDRPKPAPLPPLVRLAPLRRRAERTQVDLADPGLGQPGSEHPLREARPPRERQLPHIDHLLNAGLLQRPQERRPGGALIADGAELGRAEGTGGLARATLGRTPPAMPPLPPGERRCRQASRGGRGLAEEDRHPALCARHAASVASPGG